MPNYSLPICIHCTLDEPRPIWLINLLGRTRPYEGLWPKTMFVQATEHLGGAGTIRRPIFAVRDAHWSISGQLTTHDFDSVGWDLEERIWRISIVVGYTLWGRSVRNPRLWTDFTIRIDDTNAGELDGTISVTCAEVFREDVCVSATATSSISMEDALSKAYMDARRAAIASYESRIHRYYVNLAQSSIRIPVTCPDGAQGVADDVIVIHQLHQVPLPADIPDALVERRTRDFQYYFDLLEWKCPTS